MLQKIAIIIAATTALPIWFYLLYQILVRINASELMFFLFWIYVPATVIVQSIRVLLENE